MEEKKQRSKNLTPSVKKLVFSRAINQRNIPRYFLAKSLIKEIMEAGEVYPSLETAVRYISDARNADNPLDKPWTTEVCSDLDYTSYFPPESIPYLLQLWRYSVHLDEVFTVRHAIWAARLAFQLKDMDIAEIWLRSRRYSHEEELSFLTNTKMRIFQLDSSLVMGVWESLMAKDNVEFKDQPNEYIHHTPIEKAQDGGIAEEYINVLDDYGSGESLDRHNELKRLYYLIIELPSSSKYFPDIETRMVYLSHLSRISKLPKWKTLTPEEIRDIIIDLRKWALEPKLRREEQINNKHPVGIFRMSGLSPALFPTQIYERLGWSLKGD